MATPTDTATKTQGIPESEKQDVSVRQVSGSTASESPRSGSLRHGTVEVVGSLSTSSSDNNPPAGDPACLESGGPVERKKGLVWWQALLLMVAETISLGILSLPIVVSYLGLIPGGVLCVVFGTITTYTGYIVYKVKLRYREITCFPSALEMFAGSWGRWITESLVGIFLIFLMGGHIFAFSNAVSTLTGGDKCTITWSIVALAVLSICTMGRAFSSFTILAAISFVSITAATAAILIDLGIHSHGGHDRDHFGVTPASTLAHPSELGSLAVSSIILSYTGHIAYFPIMEEMVNIKDFPKALIGTNIVTITMYTLTGVLIYLFAGQDVEALALNSATPVGAKIAFGLAIPTIIAAGVIVALVAAKRVYTTRWSNDPDVMLESTFRARFSWQMIQVCIWVVAWIVANVIPSFNTLLGVIGALIGTWLCLGFPAIFWLKMAYDDKELFTDWKQKLMTCWHTLLLILAVVLCILGVYGSIATIVQEIVSPALGTTPWKPFCIAIHDWSI